MEATRLEALNRLLEALGRLETAAELQPVVKRCAKGLGQAFSALGQNLVRRVRDAGRPAAELLWEPLFDQAVAETRGRFEDPLFEAIGTAIQLGRHATRRAIGAPAPVREAWANPLAGLASYVGAVVGSVLETTRGYVGTLMKRMAGLGATLGETTAALQEKFRTWWRGPAAATETRAETIASAEVLGGYSAGQLDEALRVSSELEVPTEKRWVTMQDDRVEPNCIANEEAGWIPTEEPFPSGAMRPLDHPRCRCRLEVRPAAPRAKVMGFSFVPKYETLPSVAAARTRGEGRRGWKKNEEIFRSDYLRRYQLEAKVERTIGLWGGPEPSFNVWLKGERDRIIAMADEWGRRHKQAAVALLLPNPGGSGGALSWDFGRSLSDEELDKILGHMRTVNAQLAPGLKAKFNLSFLELGLTVRKGERRLEFWVDSPDRAKAGIQLMDAALKLAGLQMPAPAWQPGFDFVLREWPYESP